MLRRMDRQIFIAVLIAFCAWLPATVRSQQFDAEDRPVAEVRIKGLNRVSEQLVRNNIRLKAGEPYNGDVVDQDVVRLDSLGRFTFIAPDVEALVDGSLVVTYVVREAPLLADVQFAGNKAVTDQALAAASRIRTGDPADPGLVEQAIIDIKAAYGRKGYFLTDVTYDQELLNTSGLLIFQVREGPKIRIRRIAFEGNDAFHGDLLMTEVRSRTYIPVFRGGELSREKLDNDRDSIRRYYRSRGFLDAEVARDIAVSPDQKDAVITFVVDEGRRYLVGTVRVEGVEIFTTQEIRETIELKAGDIFSLDLARQSVDAVQRRYGKLGFLETSVVINRAFHERDPLVDVVVTVTEGKPYVVGKVTVRGNETTKDTVVIRQIRGLNPGRYFDLEGMELTKRRLRESPLFSAAEITLGGDVHDLVRDVLLEVKEKNTGNLAFGAGVSSDSGFVGSIDLTQSNFDIANTPDSVGELFTGKAFRGAGQFFSLSIQPGSEVSNYAVSFREPYLLDSDLIFDANLFLYQRDREDYDEGRIGGNLGLGQRFGDVWSTRVGGRYEFIDINIIERLNRVPDDLIDVEGESTLTTLALSAIRNTTDSRVFPTIGSRLTMGPEFGGAFGGDYDYIKLNAGLRNFWTVDEDFLGRRTVLSSRIETGYVVEGDAPIFEQYYAGGHRSFRGFDFRGVGPHQKGDPIGGDWIFLFGLEYNFPIYEDLVRFVLFTDTGTVDTDVSFDKYRVAVGAGFRVQIPFLGQAPFALDFGYPLVKEKEDETRLFSFSLAVPF